MSKICCAITGPGHIGTELLYPLKRFSVMARERGISNQQAA